MDYNKIFPLDTIEKGEDVYIVDYSIDTLMMERLLQITSNVCWIDHHKTSIEKYANFATTISGLRYDGLSGAMLTYLYLELDILYPEEIEKVDFTNIPMAIRLVNDWDIGKFEFGLSTTYFKTATDSLFLHPQSVKWPDVNYNYDKLIKDGKSMVKFRDQWAEQYMKKGFITLFEGHKCFAVNLGSINSEYFKSVVSMDIDIFIAFVFDGKQWTVSLYSNSSVDVSEIAKKYGGGGHKGAAGFSCEALPFVKEDD